MMFLINYYMYLSILCLTYLCPIDLKLFSTLVHRFNYDVAKNEMLMYKDLFLFHMKCFRHNVMLNKLDTARKHSN